MGYGIPYKGSKSRIIRKLSEHLPNADHFYDVFGGGGAVSHYMATERSQSFKTINYNEIDKTVCNLLKDAIQGKYSYDVFKPLWVSREDFKEARDNDGYVQQVWSFGNNGIDYLFSKEIEPYKRSMHMAVVFNKFDKMASEVLQISEFPHDTSIKQRRLFLRNKIEWYRKNGIPDYLKIYLPADRLQQLQQLQRLQRLCLNITNFDYKDLVFKPNSVIYCDPPYEGTDGYKRSSFNKPDFLDWAYSQENPVYISEYVIDDPRFYLVCEIDTLSTLCATNNAKRTVERLYCNRRPDTVFEQMKLF